VTGALRALSVPVARKCFPRHAAKAHGGRSHSQLSGSNTGASQGHRIVGVRRIRNNGKSSTGTSSGCRSETHGEGEVLTWTEGYGRINPAKAESVPLG
jgi:hypothetical protein